MIVQPVKVINGINYIANGYSEVILSNASLSSNGTSNIYKVLEQHFLFSQFVKNSLPHTIHI